MHKPKRSETGSIPGSLRCAQKLLTHHGGRPNRSRYSNRSSRPPRALPLRESSRLIAHHRARERLLWTIRQEAVQRDHGFRKTCPEPMRGAAASGRRHSRAARGVATFNQTPSSPEQETATSPSTPRRKQDKGAPSGGREGCARGENGQEPVVSWPFSLDLASPSLSPAGAPFPFLRWGVDGSVAVPRPGSEGSRLHAAVLGTGPLMRNSADSRVPAAYTL